MRCFFRSLLARAQIRLLGWRLLHVTRTCAQSIQSGQRLLLIWWWRVSNGVGAKKTAAVLKRDGGLCVLKASKHCQGEATCADHRANRGKGGAKSGVLDKTSNLIAACGICNGFKEAGADRAELIARGVRVESHSTHAKTAVRAEETPVTYPDGSRWLLDDAGGKRRV